MKNYIQSGDAIDAIAPVGGVVSGVPLLIGALFGVPGITAAEGAPFPLHVEGVFALPKTAGTAWAIGDKVYWDAAAKSLTKTAAGNTLVGVAAAVAAAPDVKGNVLLGIVA